ncbi:MAG: hypothetical protein JKY30_03545 [Flavobacteriales bacterium]|nr:hypothetical protein [Flavobacteriales bacterium]
MLNSDSPYISFVVTSRNDNHGEDMLKRMTIFVNGLIHQCNKYKLPCELLFVEWNPPKENELLHTVLPKTGESDYLKIKYVVVPEVIHSQLNNSEKLPLFQMIAKNVGIRRAAAEFVVCTNVDLLFADELFASLVKRELQHKHFYRANRCDVPNTIDENESVEEQLSFCKKNIIKRLGKSKRFPIFKDQNGIFFKYKIYHPLLIVLAWVKKMGCSETEKTVASLDFDACGDFTLMSKKDWIAMQGYAEFELYSIHIDSVGLFSAAALNYKQVVFDGKACTYHIEHKGGWEFESKIEEINFISARPMLDWWTIMEAGKQLVESKRTINFNKANWGLNDIQLNEIEQF